MLGTTETPPRSIRHTCVIKTHRCWVEQPLNRLQWSPVHTAMMEVVHIYLHYMLDDYMISHFAGNPQGPSPSFFFSRGPVGCSGTLCVVGAAAAVSFTPLLGSFCVWFCVVVVVVVVGVVVFAFVFVLGVVLYAAAAPALGVPSSHG